MVAYSRLKEPRWQLPEFSGWNCLVKECPDTPSRMNRFQSLHDGQPPTVNCTPISYLLTDSVDPPNNVLTG
jgi:hypothetical protein